MGAAWPVSTILCPIGRPAADRQVIGHLAPQTDGIILNANSTPERFEDFSLKVVADRIEGCRGPLAGIQTLMQAAQPMCW